MQDLKHRENFQRMLQGRGPERLNLDLTMTPPVIDQVAQRTGSRDAVAVFDCAFRGLWVNFPENRAAWLTAFARIGAEVPDDAEICPWGTVHIKPPAESVGQAYHFRTMLHPLAAITTPEQLRTLPWPDYQNPIWYADLPARIDAIHAEGRVAVAGLECTIFEHAWYVRGMDNLFMDLADGNGIADFLLDFYTARSIKQAEEYTRAGIDCICLGDDVGTQRGMMMSVAMWREHLKGRLAAVIAAIRIAQKPGQHVWVRYHSDGDIRTIIPDLIEIGVDILNPMQPECMPLDEVIAKYQDRVAFWGLIGTQTLMPFGTPDEIRTFVDRCVQWHRAGARMIVAPTHVLEPDVPYANIEALAIAVHGAKIR